MNNGYHHANAWKLGLLMSHPVEAAVGPGGRGGGTLNFSAYVGWDPASTRHPKKISGISNTPKRYLKFS